MRIKAALPLVLALACSSAVHSGILDDDDPVDPDATARSGVAFAPERTHNGPSPAICSIGFLVTNGHRVYETTERHCYEVTGSHPTEAGSLDHGAPFAALRIL